MIKEGGGRFKMPYTKEIFYCLSPVLEIFFHIFMYSQGEISEKLGYSWGTGGQLPLPPAPLYPYAMSVVDILLALVLPYITLHQCIMGGGDTMCAPLFTVYFHIKS